MNNEKQLSNEQNYFLTKRQEINQSLLLPTEKFLQESYNFIAIKELKKDPNFIFLIGGWIAQTSVLMQIKSPTDNFLKQDIVNMLTGYWSGLSFEEIIKAFELERFGEYDERTEHFQIFDSNYISKILKKYNEWRIEKKRRFHIKAKEKFQEVNEEVVKQNAKKIMTDAIINKYSEFLNTNEVSEPFSHIFQELLDRGLIKTASEQTPKLLAYYNNKLSEARKQVLAEMQQQTHPEKNKRNEIKAIIDSIVENKYNDDAKSKIEVRAKKLVLIDFFTKIKTEDLNINEIIK